MQYTIIILSATLCISCAATPDASTSSSAAATAASSTPSSTLASSTTVAATTNATLATSDASSPSSSSSSSSTTETSAQPTSAPESTASLASSSSSAEAATTAAAVACNPALNLSPNLSPFWIVSVLEAVPAVVNVSGCQWLNDMESRLLQLLAEANAAALTARRKRAAAAGSLQMQVVRSQRLTPADRVQLVYYAMHAGVYIRAAQAVDNIRRVQDRAAIVLGYPLHTAAATYESVVAASPDRLWVMGLAFAVLGGLLLLVWAVLLAYSRCLRPRRVRQPPADVVADEFYTDSLRPIAHMRANPKISYSNTDIEVIADQVARRLDAHMSEMMMGRHSEKNLNEWAAPAAAAAEAPVQAARTQSEEPKRRRLPRTPSEAGGSAAEQQNCVQLRRLQAAARSQHQPSTHSIDKGRRRHEHAM